MRKLAFAAVAALTLSAVPASAGQSNDYVPGDGVESEAGPGENTESSYGEQAQVEARLNDQDELIDWLDQLEADMDSGSLLLIRPENSDGGLRGIYVPVDRDQVIRMIRTKVALGEMTSEQGAAMLIVMATESGRHRRALRATRQRLADQRLALRRGGEPLALQPWELGQPPAYRPQQPTASTPPPQPAACPPQTRWRVEVNGSQYSYHYVLVFRDYGTAVLVLPSGDEMTWVQTQGRLSGSSIVVNTRDTNGSGSLNATLSPDCMQGRGTSQAYNGNNGPAILTRLN